MEEAAMERALQSQIVRQAAESAAKKLLVWVSAVMALALAYTNDVWAQAGAGDVTLAPGQTATLNYKMFCISFGMPLTLDPVQFKGRSAHSAKHILAYAHSKGYVDSNPIQVQLAIWRKTTGEWKAPDHAIADEILKNAGEVPAESGTGVVFLTDAVKAGTVQLAVKPVDLVKVPNSPVDWPWLGDGQMTLTNKSNQSVTVRVRDGFEMTEPHQHMIGYVTGLAK
jgi:hypothetical protein